MSNEYKPHLLEWTDEKVARFWNFRNNYQPYDDTWFTQQAGDSILKMAGKYISSDGKILDYGTGKGFLVQHLLNFFPKSHVYACDFTDSLVAEVDLKYRNNNSFMGCSHLTQLPSEYQSGFFDAVFLIETIEHLTDQYLHSTLHEIERVLKPGGTIVITTPNNEVLEKTFVHCADCGASFHHMQHVRSWNTSNLGSLMKQFNFTSIQCKGMNLQWYHKRGLFYYAADQVKRIFGNINKPNLVFIGRKN
jgi:2-polyprenyl-3-methyl-5-hydroxy-6-metoxy-1,4-benzoquinol methylase